MMLFWYFPTERVVDLIGDLTKDNLEDFVVYYNPIINDMEIIRSN